MTHSSSSITSLVSVQAIPRGGVADTRCGGRNYAAQERPDGREQRGASGDIAQAPTRPPKGLGDPGKILVVPPTPPPPNRDFRCPGASPMRRVIARQAYPPLGGGIERLCIWPPLLALLPPPPPSNSRSPSPPRTRERAVPATTIRADVVATIFSRGGGVGTRFVETVEEEKEEGGYRTGRSPDKTKSVIEQFLASRFSLCAMSPYSSRDLEMQT